MKSEPDVFTRSRDAAHDATPELSIDRRRFVQYLAGLGAMAGLGMDIFAQSSNDRGAQAATPNRNPAGGDSLLPDGTEYAAWEQPLNFSKTYYVDNASAQADDNGPGTQARPFRTVGKASEVLQPGERVVIASGIYRECLRPVRAGESPARMISYEAAPGVKVYIRGSEVLKDGWEQQTVSSNPRPAAGQASPAPGVTVWKHDLTAAMFPDAYNPFALASIMGTWEWLDPRVVDMGPYLRRRGLVFADGKPLEPMEQLRELAMPKLPPIPDFTVPAAPQNGEPPRRRGGPIMQEIGGSPDARFWVNEAGNAVYVRLSSGTPSDHVVEVTTRQHTVLPIKSGLGYIRIKGLTFQHAGNAYPFPQFGMISPAGGDHWILEDNTIEWANGMGLDLGRDGDSDSAQHVGASHIVRRNTFRYCGVEAIGGMGTTNTLIEDNLIEWCGWADAERGWEAAGAKFHFGRNLLFRRNVVRHIRHANAIWLDSGNVNCRLTRNIFADILTVGAGVHMEMNIEQNQIDNNVIWDVRNAEPGTPGQRGCAGSGIFINATDHLIIAQNLIGKCDNSGIFAIARPDRVRSGAELENKIDNNIFARCGRSAIIFINPNNQADGNLFVAMPNDFLGFYQGDSKQYLDLASWRGTHGWDKESTVSDMEIDFNPDTLQLTIGSSKGAVPKAGIINRIDSDILGKSTGTTRSPGPVADLGAKQAWHLDPRSAA